MKKSIKWLLLAVTAVSFGVVFTIFYHARQGALETKKAAPGHVVECIATTEKNARTGTQRPEDTGLASPVLQEAARSAYIDVSYLSQYPELPTGCEITSLTMVMNYLGFPVSKTTMASKYLVRGGVDFWNAFVGDPFREDGFGCYAQPIVEAANRYFTEKKAAARAVNCSGSSFDDLLEQVQKGVPVIVWNTMGMEPARETVIWDTGRKKLTWLAPEHCVVLIGYNLDTGKVSVADPTAGMVERDLEVFKKRYLEMHAQAVCITAN